MRIDLSMTAVYPASDQNFDHGFEEALTILKEVEKHRRFSKVWKCFGGNLWEEHDKVRSYFLQTPVNADPKDASFGVNFDNYGSDSVLEIPIELHYNWGDQLNTVLLKFRQYDNVHGLNYEQISPILKTIIMWKNPMHLSLGSVSYAMHDHPLSMSRLGIRWIGWLPFNLNPSDVSEAEVVENYLGGTFVASQKLFWQPDEGYPGYSKEAIKRTQAVEIQLAQLGVLPTYPELLSGAWR